MDRRELLDRAARDEDERLLLGRVWDKWEQCRLRSIPTATDFLSPQEQAAAQRLLGALGVHDGYVFFGGYDGAERQRLFFLPDWAAEPEPDAIAAVTASWYGGESLTHRDFLGSLMGAGIKRETVGDIYVSAGQCDILVTRQILPYLLEQWDSAGRTKLHLSVIPLAEVQRPAVEKREIRDTVPSLRLDCLVGSAFSLARGPAGQLIAAGRVAVNDLVCLKGDRQLQQGDRIAVRGLGKAALAQVGGTTRKGRLSVTLERWI